MQPINSKLFTLNCIELIFLEQIVADLQTQAIGCTIVLRDTEPQYGRFGVENEMLELLVATILPHHRLTIQIYLQLLDVGDPGKQLEPYLTNQRGKLKPVISVQLQILLRLGQ